jgi:uroporphyrinogen-III synthase
MYKDKHFLMLILIFRTRLQSKTTFSIKSNYTNLIFSSQNAVVSLMEQNGWEALKTKMVFCVGIKTKELLEWFYGKCLWITPELAEIITLIYNKESYILLANLRKNLTRSIENRRDCV